MCLHIPICSFQDCLFHMGSSHSLIVTATPHITLLKDAAANELIVLRWLHFISGITWIGLLYFFNLVGTPAMRVLEPSVRKTVYPELMSRAMTWFRWSALVTVAVGMRYFVRLLTVDAQNAGNPALTWRWFAWWFLIWLLAYVPIYALQLPAKGMF